MRCFLGLRFPEPVNQQLARTIERLRRTGAAVRWVPEPNLHLTLKFLGEVLEEAVADLQASLSAIQAAPLSLVLDGLGCFPNLRRPRVVWVGLGGDVDGLAALAGEIGSRCEALGFSPEERPFRAHLTLGRVKNPRNLSALIESIEKAPAPGAEAFLIDEFALFRSELGPAGARYQVLGRFPLLSAG